MSIESNTYGRSQKRSLGALVLALILALSVVACGSGDEGESNSERSESVTTTPGGNDGSGGDGDSNGGESPDDDGGQAPFSCEDLVTSDEVSELFGGAEAILDTDNLHIGGAVLNCSYSTADTDDFETATHIFSISIWPNKAFYNPDMIYEGHEDISDLGDDAYVHSDGNVAVGFLEGDTPVMIDYSIIDLTSTEPQAPAKKDEIVEMLRMVHERMS